MAYTYSTALVTTLKDTVDPYFPLFGDTQTAESIKRLMYKLIDEICTEFATITSEA